jgi:hypothetical protein
MGYRNPSVRYNAQSGQPLYVISRDTWGRVGHEYVRYDLNVYFRCDCGNEVRFGSHWFRLYPRDQLVPFLREVGKTDSWLYQDKPNLSDASDLEPLPFIKRWEPGSPYRWG